MKILTLGIDGGSWDIINMGVEENKLLTFKHLIENGVHGTLRSTIPPTTLPAIPSFITGKNPGRLGIYSFIKDSIPGRIITSLDIRDSTLWDILGRNDIQCCVVEIPLTYPAKEINGIMISGPPLPSSDCDFTWPRDLKLEIDYPIESAGRESLEETARKKGVGYLFDKYRDLTKKKLDTFKQLLAKEDYDFSIFFVKGSDVLQHFLWEEKHLLLEYYRIIDVFLKEMLDWNKFDLIIIFSDHGFDEETRYFHINNWLERERYLSIKKPIRFLYSYSVILEAFSKLRYFAFKSLASFSFLPGNKGNKILKTAVGGKNKVESVFKVVGGRIWGVDWNKTIAWSQNRSGIEISPSLEVDEYKQIREEIIRKLSELEIDGEKIIRMVKRREEEYNGRYIHRAPDIVFLLEKGIAPRVSLANDILVMPKRRIRTGQHRSAINGVFIAYGKSVKKGAETEQARIYDVTPTILHTFGLPIPTDMDGRVLTEIFTEGSELAQREVKYQEIDMEREKIKEGITRLRASGKL